MAIQPIDLQTLYTQLDKVGKAQVQQQAAAKATQDSENVKNIRESEHRLHSVSGTEAGDEKTESVHERNGSGQDFSASSQSGGDGQKEDAQKEPEKEIIKDPALGLHIDISG